MFSVVTCHLPGSHIGVEIVHWSWQEEKPAGGGARRGNQCQLILGCGSPSPEQLDGLEEDGPEPPDVEPDVLLPEVDVIDERPALLVDGHGVQQHGVRPRVHLRQRALLRRDVVLDVPHVHVPRRHPVLVHGEALHPPQRHHLHHHRVHRQEHQVGQPGPVHRHHHVERVHQLRRVRHARVPFVPDAGAGLVVVLSRRRHQVRRRHVEPDLLRQRHDLRDVHEPPPRPPGHQQQPGPPVPTPGPGGLLLVRPDGVLPRQRVPPHEEAFEVHHGQVPRRASRVDAEVLEATQPQRGLTEAPHLAGAVEVHGVVVGEPVHDLPVLVEPPRLLLRHQQLHLAAQVARRHEQRDDVVVEVVVVVAAVAAVGVHHGGDVVPHRAGRRVAGGHHAHRQRRDATHHADLAFPRVRLDRPARRVHPGRQTRHVRRQQTVGAGAGDDEDLRRAPADADGAFQLAHVRPRVREVAPHPGLRDGLLLHQLEASPAVQQQRREPGLAWKKKKHRNRSP